MIKLIGDYHTHTIYSSGFRRVGRHAKATIRDNAQAALAKGLKEIAICDHGPYHYLYGVREKNIPLMRDEINRLNEEFMPRGLKILLGLEANLIGLDGSLDVKEGLLDYLDILLMGYHYGARPKGFWDGMALYGLSPLSSLANIGRARSMELNTKAYIRAIKNYPIDLISHPGSKAKIDIVEVAKVAGKYKTLLEISGKHGQLSVENLVKLRDIEVDFMVNSDAHRPGDVGNVGRAIERANKANIPLMRIKNIEIN